MYGYDRAACNKIVRVGLYRKVIGSGINQVEGNSWRFVQDWTTERPWISRGLNEISMKVPSKYHNYAAQSK
jgi:hypothetical protein